MKIVGIGLPRHQSSEAWLLVVLAFVFLLVTVPMGGYGQAAEVREGGAVMPSVLLVTTQGWTPKDGRVPDSWLRHEQDSYSWWSGTGFLGSSEPVRVLAGLLTGIPPIRLEELTPKEASRLRKFSIYQSYLDAGADAKARAVGHSNDRAILQRLVPGRKRYSVMRDVLAEVRGLKRPFFFWFGSVEPRAAGQPGVEEWVARLLDGLGAKADLSNLVVVVTSVFDERGDGTVPLLIRLPNSLGCSDCVFSELLAEVRAGREIRKFGEPLSRGTGLEVVGSSLLAWAGIPRGPAAAPSWSDGGPLGPHFYEERRSGELVGLRTRVADQSASVQWQAGKLSKCWQRSDRSCEFNFALPEPDAEAERALQSVLLRELERRISRTRP